MSDRRWTQTRGFMVAFSELLDGSYPPDLCQEAIDRRRLDKLSEEVGEVIDAYSGMVGENPRKGVTHKRSDVLDELLDVAMCALAAYEHIDGHRGNSIPALHAHSAARFNRLNAAMRGGVA